MNFTDEQLSVINDRNHNLLVSAAAGSGKTAVLIERIVKKITDPLNPVSIDSIVVVTFTKAAANEMKERLTKALEGNPENARQISLIDNAHICTIDKFCTYIVKNYYNVIGLDPTFRVADEGELRLIREDVAAEMLERHFAAGEEDFINFVEAYSPGKKIDGIKDIIFSLHKFAQSNPWPAEWLKKSLSVYDNPSEESYNASPLVKRTLEFVKNVCSECVKEYDKLIGLCNEPFGPNTYRELLIEERAIAENASKADTFNELAEALDYKFKTLPKAPASCDAELKSSVQLIRNNIKDSIKSIAADFLKDDQAGSIKYLSAYANVLYRLVTEFDGLFKKRKSERNILDFNDLEHFALDILVRHDANGNTPTEIAAELSEQFCEIYIDEYQDSNLVQECILGAISRPDNRFMVGDVKQSIYRFRMAQPEIFMDKYEHYSKNPADGIKIELHNNFRSRGNVIDCVNDIFSMSMHKEIGGVEYNDDVKLYQGRNFDNVFDDTTEIMLYDDGESELSFGKAEKYANMAACSIEDMMAKDPSLKYSDFVILLRSANESGPVYANVLNNRGIPCSFSSSKGYFDAFEICQVMDLLRVIDNPVQDIPLASAMRSYFGGFTAQELAEIKAGKRKKSLYDCLLESDHPKARGFLSMISEYRNMAGVIPIHELLTKIVYDTGYYDFCGALQNGVRRKNNVVMLITKAQEYSGTSYCGLFNFLRYIDKIREYEVEYGENSMLSERDNVVRVYSIHKSKGLQFPIVILGDTDKRYNVRETQNQIIFDSDYGIAMKLVDQKTRIRKDTAYYKMLAAKVKRDILGEELRLLYVALTRAEKKLIILGMGRSEKKQASDRALSLKDRFTTIDIMNSLCYQDLIMPAAVKYADTKRYVIRNAGENVIWDLAKDEVSRGVSDFSDLVFRMKDGGYNEDLYNEICDKMNYVYPYSNLTPVHTKYSVSEIKHREIDDNDDEEVKIIPPELNKPVPAFIGESKALDGTSYGNAYHKFFEIMDYSSDVEKQIADAPWCRDIVKAHKIRAFLESPIGQDMKKAHDEGRLFREQPFTILVPSKDIIKDSDGDEEVFVQGVIDAFYIEGDTAVIVDYKTDSVSEEDGERVLRERYEVQLNIYARAVRQLTGVSETRCVIYSVKLDREMEI